jgi:hypothetical protein
MVSQSNLLIVATAFLATKHVLYAKGTDATTTTTTTSDAIIFKDEAGNILPKATNRNNIGWFASDTYMN